jgi:hypothetical protein
MAYKLAHFIEKKLYEHERKKIRGKKGGDIEELNKIESVKTE